MEAPSEEAKDDLAFVEGLKQLFFTSAAALGAMVTVVAIVALISCAGTQMCQISPSCKTQTCITQALEMSNHINVGIDPCKNVYAFACNNMDDGVYNISAVLLEKKLLKLEKLYSQPIADIEHPLVKTQKNMYQACMDETEITQNAHTTVKETLKKLGGWPVIEGAEWSETTFDWMDTVYKLRELGYDFSSFLQVAIVPDPKHEDNYIFEVSIPHISGVYSKWFDSSAEDLFMADVAGVFGADTHTAMFEMNETHQFLQELRQKRNELTKNQEMPRKTTIEKLQQNEAGIDWLKFINGVVGPLAEVYADDFVLFPPEKHLDEWLMLVQKTSKRTLANYMMWKVVEEVLPYLTDDLYKGGARPRLISHVQDKKETHSNFCINEIRKRFTPNPIEIMYIRKYLPEKKRRKVEEIVRNMKTEFVKITKAIKWMDSEDKQNAGSRISDMRVVIGVPANYFDDAIFNSMILGGLSNIDDNNFLTMLSQAKKNNLDWLYSLINKSVSETKIVMKNLLSNVIEYNVDKNEMNIPATMVQEPIFNEKQPNYLNYARLGVALKDIFFEVLGKPFTWSNQSKEALKQNKECLIRNENVEKTSAFDLLLDSVIADMLGIKISYGAYNNWAKNNQEPPLIALNYTSEQLFWITSAYSFCENTLGFSYADLGIQEAEAYYSAIYKVLNNNLDLAHDFNCSVSRVNFKNFCKVF